MFSHNRLEVVWPSLPSPDTSKFSTRGHKSPPRDPGGRGVYWVLWTCDSSCSFRDSWDQGYKLEDSPLTCLRKIWANHVGVKSKEFLPTLPDI